MNTELARFTELFEKNNKIIKKKYWFQNVRFQVLSGLIHTLSGKEADTGLLDGCRGLFQAKFGALSPAREDLELLVMTYMAVSGSPEEYADRLKERYDAVSKGNFFPGDFEMLAAMTLMKVPDGQTGQALERMKEIYAGLGKKHPLLTKSADKSAAAFMALSKKSVDELVDETERCYKLLRKEYRFSRNKAHSMSELLAVQDGNPGEKCEGLPNL